VYTRYISPAGYGVVELLANGVIFISILVRFGMIEAFLRFYFSDEDQARRDALARRAVLFLLVATTVVAGVLAAAAEPLSRLILGYRDTTTFLVAVLGLWSFTNLELAYGLLRVDERLRTYATASLANVGMTIAASVVLVVVLGDGARGLLLGNYGASTVVLLALWWTMRHRLVPRRASAERMGQLLRFGLPTVPAEASVYALSIIDRYYIYHDRSPRLAGLYSIAIKLAGSVAFIVRAFQYAWPPLAYSVTDDAEAARLYGLVTTYYLLISGWVVAGLALLGRWVIRLLTTNAYFGAYRALPWVALGWALYGLWVVFLVIAGRAKVTTRNFPAALAGLIANVVLLVALVPPLGIAGAGVALCGAYVVMLGIMHLLTRRAFTVAFEWRRLAHLTVVIGGLAVAGELSLPTHGFVGFVTRVVVFLLIPVVLAATGFPHAQELGQLRALVGRLRGLSPSAARSGP
jgi:O-antigen/teichoic acid export membrane protein